MAPDDPRHGTTAGYRAKCRCSPCRTANTRYSNQRRLAILRGQPLRVDSTGTIRRIEALRRMGWTLEMIAEEAGWNSLQAVNRITHRPEVSVQTRDRIAAVYDRLSMKPGPSAAGRRAAERLGYAPPLAWDNIDDPDEQPSGATLATVTPIRERTWDTADHRACPRCGVVRSTHADGLRGDLCRDCRQEVA